MGRTIWHCHIAVSLDGKIARPDGGVDDWLVADYRPRISASRPSLRVLMLS